MATSPVPHVIVIGGGIIGCTTAYYLTKMKTGAATGLDVSVKVTLIEASENGPAQGASGKAGGLVAKWAYPKTLVNVSYAEHEKLAAEHNGKDRWGWRYVGCGSWYGTADFPPAASAIGGDADGQRSLEKELGLPGGTKPDAKGRKEKGLPDDLLWVREDLTSGYSPMAGVGDTAQVHPYLFTRSMFELAKENGLEYIQGAVTKVLKEDGKICGVEYQESSGERTETILATHVVVAAGAWSPRIVEDLPISATRAHSITIRPQLGVDIAPYVLFTEIVDSKRGINVSPEIYARPNNEVYACGPGDDEPLPATVDNVTVNASACDSIVQHVTAISEDLKNGTVDKRQACYLPVVSLGGGPIVGHAEQIARGLYLATGHTCWGICNAPGTALAISQLILDGRIRCGDFKKLSPANFV